MNNPFLFDSWSKELALVTKDLERFEPLSADEQSELFERLAEARANGDSRTAMRVRHELIIGNWRLVLHAMKKYRMRFDAVVNPQDMFNQGILGLARAVDCFDTQRTSKFSTYAVMLIDQALIQLVDKNSPISRGSVSDLNDIKQKQAEFFERYGREPSLEELAREVELSPKVVSSRLAENGLVIVSLEESAGGSDDHGNIRKLWDVISEDGHFTTEPDIHVDLDSLLALMREKLNLTEQRVLVHLFGLNGSEPLTLQATAKKLGLDRQTGGAAEKVRQLKVKALAKLRDILLREQQAA